MYGLDITFLTLATTPNTSAIDVLISALEDGDKYLRRRALGSLLQRSETSAATKLLSLWNKLDEENREALKASKKWIQQAVLDALLEANESVHVAIKATATLELYSSVSSLLDLAETHRSRTVRQESTTAVLTLAQKLGFDARHDRDVPSARRPLIARLDTSVRCLSVHRNETLIDAFLMASTWSDASLRLALQPDHPAAVPLLHRLEESPRYGVVELLAGFLRRRKIASRVAGVIQRRPDEVCRDAILRTITKQPSNAVLRNLRSIGLPMSCRGDEKLMRELPAEQRAAFAHLHIAVTDDITTLLQVLVTAVELGGPGCCEAAVVGLDRCEVPNFQFWLSAGLLVADGNAEAIAGDPRAGLLKRLIDLLAHRDAEVVRGVNRVLGALRADNAVAHFKHLDLSTGQRLGRIVMTVDPDAIHHIRDGLRHPVMKHRLAAIDAAEALAAVDLLVDLFTRISRDDHQEARIRAAQAMGRAGSEPTLELLREMTELPDCAARDAAVAALEYRQNSCPSWSTS